jgi:hypothetical protein
VIGSPDLAASHSVQQLVEVVLDPSEKEARLDALLRRYHASRKNRVLVFVLYKKVRASTLFVRMCILVRVCMFTSLSPSMRVIAVAARVCPCPSVSVVVGGQRARTDVPHMQEADRVERYLQRRGWAAGSIHGDKSQHERTTVLEAYGSTMRTRAIAAAS